MPGHGLATSAVQGITARLDALAWPHATQAIRKISNAFVRRYYDALCGLKRGHTCYYIYICIKRERGIYIYMPSVLFYGNMYREIEIDMRAYIRMG